jgi:DNA-binding CsgD family transcriptional regulator/predicted ArsR family transcriptional regulator
MSNPRSKRQRVRSRSQSPAKSMQGSTKVLELLMNSVGDLLHPTLYQRLLSQIGERLGYHFQNNSQIPHPTNRQEMGRYLETLLSREGWDFSDVTQHTHDEEEVVFTIRSCPFGELGSQDTHVCMIEQGLIQGLAKPFASSPKLHIARGAGVPPRECRVTLSMDQPEEDVMDGVARASSLGSDELEELLENHGVSGAISKLSVREREVLTLIGDGLSDKVIADRLRISVRTVQGHGARIRHKFGVRSRTDLLRLSILQKLSRN